MKNVPHNQSVLPTVQQAIDTLQGHKNSKSLVRRIQQSDPYHDKRFAPVIANWIVKLDVGPEEHAEDITRFKQLRRRLKDLRIPAANAERKRLVKELLSKGPEDFAHHYSTLQEWNRTTSDILDPQKDLSDKGLPVVMRHDGYTMYRIDNEEHYRVPLVRNAMGWCVTKRYFGQYGGPPYYPIVRDQDREPFCMVIPAHFDENPDQAVRNANNDGRISPRDLRLIRPLVQHVLPLDRHSHPYIGGVHGIKTDLPKAPTSNYAFKLMTDLAIEPGEWPKGELAISRDPAWSYAYARDVLKGPFAAGEPVIVTDPKYAYRYARDVLKGLFPQGEKAMASDAYYSYLYAKHVMKGPFLQGEKVIASDPYYSYHYAKHIMQGPFPHIASELYYSYHYAKDVIANEPEKQRLLLGTTLSEFVSTFDPANLPPESRAP